MGGKARPLDEAAGRLKECCQCGDPALAVFVMPGGCAVYPHYFLQALCLHHIVRATPLAGMFLVFDHRAEGCPGIPGYPPPLGETKT